VFFSIFPQNRFERSCKIPPRTNFSGNLSAFALFFLGFCGANPRCFQGGEKNLGQPLAAPFCRHWRFLVKYKCTQIISAGFLLGFNSRPVQVRLA
jgi:hypothetical protein